MDITATKIPDHLHPQDAHKFMRDAGLVLIDVRTEGEWIRTGLAEGAVAMTASGPEFVDGLLDLLGGDKTKPVAFICASGARSAHVQRFLLAHGFTNAINVVEGMVGGAGAGPGWILRGLPTVPYHHRRA
ncbi:MAG: rhodanese-like domain-containing protein [Hyphomicrobiaceae bacterium]